MKLSGIKQTVTGQNEDQQSKKGKITEKESLFRIQSC
jgi:hypothetical protein